MSEGSPRRFRPAPLLALMCVLCCAAFAPATASAAEPGALSGTVTNGRTAQPIEGIEVCANQEAGGSGSGCDITDANGEYAIGGLPAGEYEVLFSGQGLVAEHFSQEQVQENATATLNAELYEPGAIEGIVMSSLGGPIADSFVCVDGAEGLYFNGCGFTNDEGEYAIDELPPGEYEVEFTGQVCDGGSACEREECERQVSCSRPYVPQVYVEQVVLNAGGATLVTVEPGETTEGIEATLLPGSKIEGTVTLAALGEPPLEGLEVCASAEEEVRGECATTGANGRYAIEGLASGNYAVKFSEACPGEICAGKYVTQFYDGKAEAADADLVGVTAPGLVTGIDASMVEATPTRPAFLTNPHLSGSPSVGSTLSCSKGTWSNGPTSIAYSWQRNGTAIAGQTGATYKVTSEDEGASLTCAATIANAAGSESATSNALAVPKATPPPVPTTSVKPGVASAAGHASATAKVVKVKLKCTGQSSCKGSLKLTYEAKVKNGKGKTKTEKVAFGTPTSFSIAKGATKTIAVKLTGNGAGYLKEAGKGGLKVELTGSGVKAGTITVKRATGS